MTSGLPQSGQRTSSMLLKSGIISTSFLSSRIVLPALAAVLVKKGSGFPALVFALITKSALMLRSS
jgi:hypothetical protein